MNAPTTLTISQSPAACGRRENEITTRYNVLRRRWKLLVGCVLSVLAATALLLALLAPHYTANTQILLDPRKQNVIQSQQVVQGVALDTGVVESEVSILQSFGIARRVTERLNLFQDPEFNGAAPRFSLSFGALRKGIEALMGRSEPAAEKPADDSLGLTAEQVATVLRTRSSIAARRLGLTYVIDVGFTSLDPAKAARIANAVGDAYLVEQVEARYDAAKRASTWLNERMQGLAQQVQSAEKAVAEYRTTHKIVETSTGAIDKQQVAELSAQLALSRARTVETRAKFEQAERTLSRGGNMAAVAEVLQSPVIASLRTQEAEVARREADLTSRYGPLYPQVVTVRAELADIRRGIKSESDRIITNLKSEYEVAQKREQSLQESIDRLTGVATQNDEVRIRLRELERDAETTRSLYQSFLSRFKETREQTTLETSDSRVISQATAPVTPSSPRKSIYYGLGLILGLVIGVCGAFLVEYIENGYATAEAVENALNIPVFAMMPALSKAEIDSAGKGETIMTYVATKPMARFSEAVRSARVALSLSNVDNPPRLVLVASSVPGEGKSTMASSMAVSAATSGQRTLLVDADLRHPSSSKAFGLGETAGLVELLAGTVKPEQVIRAFSNMSLSVLPSGAATKNPPDLLGSQRMRALLQSIRDNYDLVIIDAPPVTAVIDSLVIAPHVDKIVFVIEWETTPREVVARAMNVLGDNRDRVAGVLLNKVDLDQMRFRQSYYSYYNRRYGKYEKYRGYYDT